MSKPELETALREARALLDDVTDVSADGRRLAADLADTIRSIADLQCGAIDERANALRARLTQIERKLAAA